MTPERLLEIMRITGLSANQLIRIFDVDDRRVTRMMTGKRAIPATLAAWLEALMVWWRDNPPPQIRKTNREAAEGDEIEF